jgi:probable HAF family extracellular repeat protein
VRGSLAGYRIASRGNPGKDAIKNHLRQIGARTPVRGSAIRFFRAPLLVALLLADSAIGQPTIANLGVFTGGSFSSANALSADGSTVTGNSNGTIGTRAFRWTAGGGMQNLGILASNGPYSAGDALSSDGSVVAGISAGSNNNNLAFRWTAAAGMQSLGVLGTGSASAANAISADGSVVAGFSYTAGFTNGRAFRWTAGGGMQNLGILPGGSGTDAFAISADGSVVAGVDNANGAFRWTSAGGMQDLGDIPGGNYSEAIGLSPDGSVATGDGDISALGDAFHAFRWTSASGMQDLGVLAGGVNSQGRGISADNSIIVGTSESTIGVRAFLWTRTFGMVDLNTYLSSLGFDLTGWTLTQASGISADGSAIAGYGDFNGATRAFLISNFPAPLPGDYNANGIVDAADYVVWRNGLGTTYTQNDYNVWRAHFGQLSGSGSSSAGTSPFQSAAPEPASIPLLATALFGIVLRRRATTHRKQRGQCPPYRFLT